MKTIREYLGDKSLTRLEHIERVARNLFASGMPKHRHFTLHGPEHSVEVERICGHILGLENHSNGHDFIEERDLFFLLAAAWLHDIGLVTRLTEGEDNEARQRKHLEDWIREQHHVRSRKYIEGHPQDFGLTPLEANIIGTICEAHRGVQFSQLWNSYGNTRILGALLRAADELDITSARTPRELLENHWQDMDPTPQWHWLKHFCVPEMTPFYLHRKGPNGHSIQFLAYEVVLRLPDEQYEASFWNRIVKPIKRVCEFEYVNDVLGRWGLGIACGHFEPKVHIGNDVLPGGTTVEQALSVVLVDPLPEDLENEVARLDNLMPPAGEVLRRECYRTLELVAHFPYGRVSVHKGLLDYLRELRTARTSEEGQEAYTHFVGSWQKWLHLYTAGDRGETRRLLERRSARIWRLVLIAQGDKAARRSQLTNFRHSAAHKVAKLATWTFCNSDDRALREHAVEELADVRNTDAYSGLLEALTIADTRLAAVKALQNYPGPRTVELLHAAMETGGEDGVTEAAEQVLKEFGKEKPTIRPTTPSRTVLLIHEGERPSVPTTLLSRNNLRVRTIDNPARVADVLKDWSPELALLDLPDVGESPTVGADIARLRSYQIAKEIRRNLGSNLGLIAVTTARLSDVSDVLRELNALYHSQEASNSSLLQAIELMLPRGS